MVQLFTNSKHMIQNKLIWTMRHFTIRMGLSAMFHKSGLL